MFQAIVLGLVQGLAELLPISSSAHLALTPYLFGWRDPGLAFDVALHAGTLVALSWYFRDEWRRMFVSAFRIARTRKVHDADDRMLVYLVLATIPAAIAGVLVEDLAETAFRAPWIMGTTLIVMGIVLWAVDRWAERRRALPDIGARDAVIIGVAQIFALVPGVSRSGSTITAGRALGLDRPAAARFSFLMSMPITLAAVVLKAPEAVQTSGFSAPLLAGIVAAAVSSWLAITVLLRYISRHSFGIFAVYRVVLGTIVFATLVSRG